VYFYIILGLMSAPFFPLTRNLDKQWRELSYQVKVALTLQKIREWCQENGLSNYKHPRHIMMMQQLPKNSSGKTLKYLPIE
jgi:acyl-CoA synthetase (AMP-forming)/AMP-acid ligase II